MHFIMVMCQFYILFIEDAVNIKCTFLTICKALIRRCCFLNCTLCFLIIKKNYFVIRLMKERSFTAAL